MCDVLDKLIAEGQEEALKEAETKGFGQGYERGYGQGVDHGVDQGVEKVAMQLVAKGISDQTILECTKLSQQRLDELRCQVASSKS